MGVRHHLDTKRRGWPQGHQDTEEDPYQPAGPKASPLFLRMPIQSAISSGYEESMVGKIEGVH